MKKKLNILALSPHADDVEILFLLGELGGLVSMGLLLKEDCQDVQQFHGSETEY